MKCNLLRILGLAICILVLGADARANENEVAIADSIRKYKYYAKTARQNKEYDRAIGYYTTVLQYSPQELTAAYFLGQLYYKQKKDLDNARIALRRAVSIDSLHPNSNKLLYAIHLAASKIDSAAWSLERMDSTATYQAYRQSEIDSAAWSLERVLIKNPDEADYRLKLAELYRHEGHNKQAIAHYEQLAEAEREDTPGFEDAELFKILAGLHREAGQTEQAIKWRRRLAEEGVETGYQLESIVELKLEVGNVEGAYDTLLELAKVDSQNAYSYYNQIASVASEEGDDTWRFKGLKGMVEADSKDLKSIAELVEWHQGRGEFASAKEWLRRGLKVNPEDAHLLLLKGDNLVREGDEEGAIAAFEKAKADPAWEKVAQQRIWQLRPPETEEEKLKRQFFGGEEAQEEQN